VRCDVGTTFTDDDRASRLVGVSCDAAAAAVGVTATAAVVVSSSCS
jgi:hypothetical protein